MEKMVFEKYPAYKYSGVEWLGEIPEHWEMVSNKYIFSLKKDLVGKKSADYVLLSLTLNGVIKRDMENPQGKFPAEFNTYQEVKKGDFIFCLFDVEETPRTVGLSEFDGMITGAYTVMRPNDLFYKGFLYYFYLNLDADKRMKSLYTGLRNTISKDNFFSFKTFIPPFAEQTAIANFLDRKTALIDKAIALKEKQIELLKERRLILIHKVVTRGLNPDVKLKDSGVEWIGEIPEGWEVKCAKYQIESISNGTTEEQLDIFDESNGDFVPVTRIETISDAEINMKKVGWVKYKKALERYRLKFGDILFSHINSLEMVGKTAIYMGENELFAGMNLLRIRPKTTTNAEWLHWYLKTSLSRNYFTSVAKPSINQASLPSSFIGRYKIVVPPFVEQNEIVTHIEFNNKKISTAISLKEKEIEKLKEYKSVLINEAVSGKIKITL